MTHKGYLRGHFCPLRSLVLRLCTIVSAKGLRKVLWTACNALWKREQIWHIWHILKGIYNAIKDNEVTIEEAFGKPSRSKKSKISDLLGEASEEITVSNEKKEDKKIKMDEGQTSIPLD